MSAGVARGVIIGGAGAAAAVALSMGLYFEGVLPVGYLDPVGIPTECVGETGRGVKVGVQRYTLEQCIARYPVRLQRVWEAGLSRCVYQDVTLYQGAALVSWADNVGVGAACGSTLMKQLNAALPPEVWCTQLLRWTKGTVLGLKITLPGLVKRRTAERWMCLERDWRTGEPLAIANLEPPL